MNSRTIEEQAAAWLVRRDGESWSDADAAQLATWLEESTANRVAFLRLEVGWEQSERLNALGAGKPRGVVPPRGEWRVSPLFKLRQAAASQRQRRFRPWLAFAASLLIAVLGGAYFLLFHSGEDYVTPIGGVASIPLRDGSNVTLNTASKVRVAVSDGERRIRLDRGEAYFEVAKDPSRPFVVIAGNRRVVAVGTRFSVLRDGDEIRVVVTEGKVRVESTDAPLDFESSKGGPLLLAGTIARASSTAVVVEASSLQRAEEMLSWRGGYLIFDETALADAVAEFNRYSARKVYIDDPAVAALRINGKFRATNADAFIRVLRDGFGIQASVSDDRVVLSSSP
ncbi:FecR family protein [Steroidobacter flavus]|uniref:FecR family protein n=1 Tax=Steroidobacter flavus TaxID=1842136 RepID=A0ABV8SZK5_9GAMM